MSIAQRSNYSYWLLGSSADSGYYTVDRYKLFLETGTG
jgi:hypothetical protein